MEKLHNWELHSYYVSPNVKMIKSRRVRWAGHVVRMTNMRNAYAHLIWKPDQKSPRCRCEDIIKI